jgi:hypothetical protein
MSSSVTARNANRVEPHEHVLLAPGGWMAGGGRRKCALGPRSTRRDPPLPLQRVGQRWVDQQREVNSSESAL